MKNNLVSAAVIAGLLSGISLVQAEEANHETTTASAPDKDTCKGHKDTCKSAKKGTHHAKKVAKAAKAPKDACGGKNGCGEAKKAEHKE